MKRISLSRLLKRTSAVLMAALMLMTCWVFLAPQTAEGITAGTGYTYVITGTSGSAPEDLNNISASISGASASISPTSLKDGKSATFTITVTSDSLIRNGTITITYSGDKTDGTKSVSISSTSITVNGKTISGASSSGWTFTYESGTCGGGTFSNKTTTATFSCPAAAADKVVWDTAPSGNITVPASGNSGTMTCAAHLENQYGVRMANDVSFTVSGGPAGTRTAGNEYDSYAVKATNSNKWDSENDNGTKTITVTASAGGKSTTGTYTLTNVKYTFSYDKNSTNSNVSISPSSSVQKFNGKKVESGYYPTSGSYVGYNFRGMYYKTDGDLSLTNFKKQLINNKTPGTSWKPSGTGISDELGASTKITEDRTYYAAWQAKDVKIYLQNMEDDFLCTDGEYHPLQVDENGFPSANQPYSYNAQAIIGKYDAKLATGQTLPDGPDFNPGGAYNYNFAYWQVVTSKKYTTAGSNAQEFTYDQIGQKWNSLTLKGDTVLKAIYNIETDPATYDITYLNGSDGAIYNSPQSYQYREEGRIDDPDNPLDDPVYTPTAEEAKTFTYEFLGWAEQVEPGDTVYFQTWDGTKYVPRMYSEIPLSDTRVYHDATWVAVYGRKYIDYTVDFVYTDRELQENGAYLYTTGGSHTQTLHYDELVAVPQHNVDVFNYAGSGIAATNLEGKKYIFEGWDAAAIAADAATVEPSAIWNLFTAPVPNPQTGISECFCTVTAQYRAEDAVYHILFKDHDGTVLNCSDPTHAVDLDNYESHRTCCFKYNENIGDLEDAVNANSAMTMEGVLKAEKVWREGDKEYRFIGWKPGVALDQNNEMRVKDDAEYVADYDAYTLYNVTYVNEGETVATYQGTDDTPIPCYPAPFREPDWADPYDEGEPPVKEGDDYADTYFFAGWGLEPYEWSENPSVVIAAGAASTYNTPANRDGTVLYAQYSCDATDYTVNFIYDDVVNEETGEHGMKSHPVSLHYGDSLVPPTVTQKPSDETYTYTFLRWDKTVTKTCVGDAEYTAQYTKGYVYYDAVWYQPDLTVDETTHGYTQQAAEPILVNGNNCIYFAPAAGGDYQSDAYIYDSVIFPPVQDPDLPIVKILNPDTNTYEEDTSLKYVLAGWIYKDTLDDPDGPTVLGPTDHMVRGEDVNHMSTEDLHANRAGKIEFVPIYRAAERTVQITFVIPEGETTRTETKTVQAGTKLSDVKVVGIPVSYLNDEVHQGFLGWHQYLGVDPETNEPVYSENTLADDYMIMTDITVRAAFSESAHSWVVTKDNIVVQPTFREPGIAYVVCPLCGKRTPVQLEPLQDEAIPTGRVMIQNTPWETVADFSGPSIAVAAENNFFIHTVDAAFVENNPNAAGSKTLVKLEEAVEGDETVYNPIMVGEGDEATAATIANISVPAFNEANKGSGTKDICVYVTKTRLRGSDEDSLAALDASSESEIEWTQVFDFDAYLRQNPDATQANFSTKLSDIIDLLPEPQGEATSKLAHGESFYVYVKLVDYEGNVNYFSTGDLLFDAEKPEVTVTSTDGLDSLKHCLDATVETRDPQATVEVKKDGKPYVPAGYHAGDTWFTLNAEDGEPASYVIVVTDAAGNTTRKVVELRGAHDYKAITKPATCMEDGQTSLTCRYCGYEDPSSTSVTPATGHKLRFRVQQPTCIANGSVAVSCKVCGEPINDLVEGFTAVDGIYDTEAALNALLVTDENGNPFVDEETGEPIEPTNYGYLVARNAHIWGPADITTTPTCSRFGVVKYTCSVCHETDIINGEDLEYTAYEELIEALPERIAELTEEYEARYIEGFYDNLQNPDPDYEFVSLAAAKAAADAKAIEDANAEIEAAAPLITAANQAHPQKDDEKCASDLVNIDLVNGHSWNRKVQTKQPTCTEPGETYRECRWNADHHLTVQPIPPAGHTAEEEWHITKSATCIETGLRVKYCKEGCTETVEVPVDPDDPENTETQTVEQRVIVEQEVIPLTDHTWEVDTDKNPYTVAPYQDEHGEWQQGYTWYKCAVCGEEEQRDFVDPEEIVTITFVKDDTETAIELTKGTSVTADQAPATEKTDPAYTYTFVSWTKAVWQEPAEGEEEGKWVLTDEVITLPYQVDEDTRVVATYTRKDIDYRITFLYDNGTKLVEVVKGYERYNQPVDIADPQKAATEESTFRFDGWIEVERVGSEEDEEEPVWQPVDADAAPTKTIICLGATTYLAVFTEVPITHTVMWADCSNVELKTITIRGGGDATSLAPALPTQATKEPTASQHWKIDGWDTDVSHVTEDLVVRPKQVQENHNLTQHTEEATCTEGKRLITTCTICGYTYSENLSGALGHDYKLISRDNPTETSNGTKVERCSRCNDVKTTTLTPILLKVTVQDNNGNKVSGVWVSVYDDDVDTENPIGGRATDGNGEAIIVVPEAKTYRVVVEGKSSNVTVDKNGKITGGSVPTVERGSSGGSGGGQPSHKCDCTCHQSGFWPTIFRFFHKFIKMITGEYRCCADANY